jgi:hypothetical protein
MLIPEHWPKWLVIPIGVLMIAFTIGVGLALEEVTQPLAPVIEPTPTLVMLPYAAPVSGGCVNCHTSRERLAEEAALTESDVARLYIEPQDVQSLHGRLGCVTCHRGNGQAEDLKASHVGLVVNPTTVDNAKVYCLTCHHRLRTDVPEHFIHTPHREVLMANHDDTVWSCSNCHLAVAHGARPADTHERQRELCVDCHQQQNLPRNVCLAAVATAARTTLCWTATTVTFPRSSGASIRPVSIPYRSMAGTARFTASSVTPSRSSAPSTISPAPTAIPGRTNTAATVARSVTMTISPGTRLRSCATCLALSILSPGSDTWTSMPKSLAWAAISRAMRGSRRTAHLVIRRRCPKARHSRAEGAGFSPAPFPLDKRTAEEVKGYQKLNNS